jgi:hypothetical protein
MLKAAQTSSNKTRVFGDEGPRPDGIGVMLLLWQAKAVQVFQYDVPVKWDLATHAFQKFFHKEYYSHPQRGLDSFFGDLQAKDRVIRAYFDIWIDDVERFEPQDMCFTGRTNCNVELDDNNTRGYKHNGDRVYQMYWALPMLHETGVSTTNMNRFYSWAGSIWPNVNWEARAGAPSELK